MFFIQILKPKLFSHQNVNFVKKNRIHEKFYTPLFGPKDGTEYFLNERWTSLKNQHSKTNTQKTNS
jgi:hypothetical protein